MGTYVTYDFSEYRAFFEKMGEASKDFRKELELWLDAMGIEFLNEVREQIISRNVKKTSLLLHSFEKGGEGNVWEADLGALRLEVGTSIEYALWANNGHRQQPGRFIPGYWKGDEFIYDKNAEGGMVLKASWVEGKHYFDAALKVFAPVFEKSFEKKLEQWLAKYFGT